MTLTKAMLQSNEAPSIEFMFNPTELEFQGVVSTNEDSGSRHEETGTPKVSFSHVKAYKLTINNIMFDTYEDGSNVVDKFITKFKKSVQFAPGQQRPPIYTFSWGSNVYLRRCFVEKLNYKLTMFLADGTPVRAVINSLTLKEADENQQNASTGTPNPSQQQRQSGGR